MRWRRPCRRLSPARGFRGARCKGPPRPRARITGGRPSAFDRGSPAEEKYAKLCWGRSKKSLETFPAEMPLEGPGMQFRWGRSGPENSTFPREAVDSILGTLYFTLVVCPGRMFSSGGPRLLCRARTGGNSGPGLGSALLTSQTVCPGRPLLPRALRGCGAIHFSPHFHVFFDRHLFLFVFVAGKRYIRSTPFGIVSRGGRMLNTGILSINYLD